MKNRIYFIIALALLMKLSYFLLAYSFGYSDQLIDLSILNRNDSNWYQTIATNGHETITPDQLGKCENGQIEQSYYAFFPLYPFTIRHLMNATGGSFNSIAFLLSVLISLGLFVLFYLYARHVLNSEKQAFLSTLLLMLFPFHYYFSTYYTESLFLLLLIGAFYSIDREKINWLLVCTSLLVITRPNGLFMLAPLGIYYLEKHYTKDLRELLTLRIKQLTDLWFFFLPVCIFITYCYYLFTMTGDFFAFKTAQEGWCRKTVLPWEPIVQSIGWRDYVQSAYLITFITLTIYFRERIRISYLVMLLIGIFLPLVANSITSPRFISVLFVYPFLISGLLLKQDRQVYTIGFILLFALQLYTFTFWLNSDGFSY